MIVLEKLGRPKTMDDSTNVDGISPTAKVVAGYIDGEFTNLHALEKRFAGKADIVSIGIFADSVCDFVDVEPGNPVKTPALVRASFALRKERGVWHPGFYADESDMETVVKPGLAGIPRSEYRLWVADPTGEAHIPKGYDACQDVWRNNVDLSTLAPSFFPPTSIVKKRSPVRTKVSSAVKKVTPKTVKKVVSTIHPKVQGAITGGGTGVGVARLLEAAGIHLTTAESGAVAAVLAALVAYLVPESAQK